MTTPALPDMFRRAADIIGERGWTRSSDLHPTTGGVCANGALRIACGATVYTADNGNYRMREPSLPGMGTIPTAEYGKTMSYAHMVLDQHLELPVEPEGEESICWTPKIICFNDKVAVDGNEVQQVLRETADWLESGPLAVLAGVEDAPVPYSLTQAGTQALDNKDLVSA